MPTPLRQGGLQLDWRGGNLIMMADYNDDFVIMAVDEETSYRIPAISAPKPALTLTDYSKSFDIALLNTDPMRFLIAESRTAELRMYSCTEGEGPGQARCILLSTEAISADEDIQAAFVPGNPPGVMVGHSFKGTDVSDRREYSSHAVILETPVRVVPGNVATKIEGRDVLGVDFTHVTGTNSQFRVAGGALGGTGFFRYESDGTIVGPPSCGSLDSVLLTPYKVKTQHESPKVLFRSGRGLMLTDCQVGPGDPFTTKTIWDFDFVPVQDGEVVTWIDGDFARTAVRGAVVVGNITTKLTFRDGDPVHHYVRMGKVGEKVVIVFGGAIEGLTMIRGTVDELIECYPAP